MDFKFPSAFTPFFTDVAVVTGTRRERGASEARNTAMYLPCCVLGGEASDMPSGANAAPAGHDYVILVRRDKWPDHLPPQIGDTVKVDGYSEMRIAAAPYLDGTVGWAIPCRSKEASA